MAPPKHGSGTVPPTRLRLPKVPAPPIMFSGKKPEPEHGKPLGRHAKREIRKVGRTAMGLINLAGEGEKIKPMVPVSLRVERFKDWKRYEPLANMNNVGEVSFRSCYLSRVFEAYKALGEVLLAYSHEIATTGTRDEARAFLGFYRRKVAPLLRPRRKFPTATGFHNEVAKLIGDPKEGLLFVSALAKVKKRALGEVKLPILQQLKGKQYVFGDEGPALDKALMLYGIEP